MDFFSWETGFFQAGVLIVIFSGIPLGVSMFVGVIVSILQAATQVQEQTLSFVPKLICVAAVLFLFGPWMVGELRTFCMELLSAVPFIKQIRPDL